MIEIRTHPFPSTGCFGGKGFLEPFSITGNSKSIKQYETFDHAVRTYSKGVVRNGFRSG